ncbi:unnamed protein product [Closterium sp. NIES-65]|nr:unnamed protein product [Closterium sp. NIES-65]
MTKKKRHSYTATEKLHWLKMQELQPDLSNRKLARMANVQQCQIREWKKLAERLKVSAGCRCRLAGGGRKAKYPPMERIVVRAQAKGWKDESLVQDWTTQVLVPFLRPLRDGGGRRKEALLTLDSYRGHLTESVPEELVRKAFLTCNISNALNGDQDHLILAHLRDKVDIDVLEDVQEEEEDVTHPNPFYEDPEEVAARASPQTAAEQEVHADRSLTNEEDNTDKEDNDDDDMADQYYVDEADEGAEGADSDLEDEWWAPGRYEGEEVEEWVAGADDS